MQGMMMDYPLTLLPILERANRLFGKKEIVTRIGAATDPDDAETQESSEEATEETEG